MQYVIKTVEVESSKTKQALSESQTRNQHLQEQVAMQRQVLKEMEQQLQNSHQLTVQLRAQVCRPRHSKELRFSFSFPLAMGFICFLICNMSWSQKFLHSGDTGK